MFVLGWLGCLRQRHAEGSRRNGIPWPLTGEDGFPGCGLDACADASAHGLSSIRLAEPRQGDAVVHAAGAAPWLISAVGGIPDGIPSS
jgi:hypothetical protein